MRALKIVRSSLISAIEALDLALLALQTDTEVEPEPVFTMGSDE